jgi:hypothetical protein
MRAVKIALVVTAVAMMSTTAKAANCSISYYQYVINTAAHLERPLSRCEVLANRKSTGIQKLCSVCGPVVVKVLKFERNVRRNRACFGNDPKFRRALRQFDSARANLQFFRRGCGY